jgi:hypothetical protein
MGDDAVRIAGIQVQNNRVVLAGTNEGCCEALVYQGWVEALGPDLTTAWSVDLGDWHPATGLALGAGGAAYVAGWRVTRFAPGPITIPEVMTLTLTKLDNNGRVLWTRHPHVRVSESGADVAVLENRVMVSATHHRADWLGRFTAGGALLWPRTWGTRTPVQAGPIGVTIDRSGSTWVVSLRRDRADHREDTLVRQIRADGTTLGVLSIEDEWATDVTARRRDVVITTETGIWRVAP